MDLIDIGGVNEIYPYIVATVIAGLLILLTRLFVTRWFKGKDRKDKRSLWMKFLKSDEMIDDCILTFDYIVHPESLGVSIVMSIVFGFSIPIIMFLILSDYIDSVWMSLTSSSLSHIIPSILTFYFGEYIHRMKKEDTLIDKSILVTSYTKIINWFIFGNLMIIMSYIYIIYINSSKISQSELNNIRLIFLLYFILIITLLYLLNIVFHKELLESLKSKLNEQYLKKFPYIHITTKAGEINGKIQDVFNEDLVILDDNGLKAVVEWDEISTLRLRDRGGTPLDLSYFK